MMTQPPGNHPLVRGIWLHPLQFRLMTMLECDGVISACPPFTRSVQSQIQTAGASQLREMAGICRLGDEPNYKLLTINNIGSFFQISFFLC